MRRGLMVLLLLGLAGLSPAQDYIRYYPPGGVTTTPSGSGFFASGVSLGNTSASPYANLFGDAANTLALRNGTNAQTFCLYGTYTDASNYERVCLSYDGSGYFRLQSSAAGTGAARGLMLHGAGNIVTVGSTVFTPLLSDQTALGKSAVAFKEAFVARSIQGSKTKALTEASATAVTQIAVPQTAGSNFADATIQWAVYASDGTDSQVRKGSTYLAAVNKAGTETCTVGDIGTTQVAVSAGTLTCTTSCITGLTDVVQFALNCTSSLTQTTLNALARLDMMQPNTVTPQ